MTVPAAWQPKRTSVPHVLDGVNAGSRSWVLTLRNERDLVAAQHTWHLRAVEDGGQGEVHNIAWAIADELLAGAAYAIDTIAHEASLRVAEMYAKMMSVPMSDINMLQIRDITRCLFDPVDALPKYHWEPVSSGWRNDLDNELAQKSVDWQTTVRRMEEQAAAEEEAERVVTTRKVGRSLNIPRGRH